MDDVLLVTINQRPRQRRDVRRAPPLAKPFRALQLLVQFAQRRVLENQKHPRVVVKVPVQP